MSSILVILGMKPDPSSLSLEPVNRAPYYNLFHFLFAYVFLSARLAKNMMKLDHNVNPRLDLVKYGERAVAEGKITKRQLSFLQRNESCHANSMEHFPAFVAASLFATVAGVNTTRINTACVVYTAARIAYAAAYLFGEKLHYASFRSVAWWISTIACISMLWSAGKAMNSNTIV